MEMGKPRRRRRRVPLYVGRAGEGADRSWCLRMVCRAATNMAKGMKKRATRVAKPAPVNPKSSRKMKT